MKLSIVGSLLLLGSQVENVQAHGRMLSPPHRGYMGKLSKFRDLVPINYDDDGLSAGGIGSTQSGKHGVCGDPYNGVRAHETGGKYGLFPVHREKVVGACYAPGSTIDIQVQLTANHKGYFEFGLCKLNGRNDKETEECFKSLVQPNGQHQWQVPPGNKVFTIQNTLPSGVTCDGDSHCVLRWHYIGWNNADVDINGQEHFWNCADIYISNTCGSTPPTPPSSSTVSPTTSSPVLPNTTKSPTPSSNKPTTPPPSSVPVTSKPNSECGSCNNCLYAPTNSCFVGWTEAQCSSVSTYKWCGQSVKVVENASVPTNGQCGGRHYTGPTQCNSDALCVEIDQYYSECVLKSNL